MKRKLIYYSLFGLLALAVYGCKAQKQTVNAKPNESSSQRALAFPGAEGFGKFTTGGRGGKVLVVTNLNNDGTGSFREAAESKQARTIVFAVSGTIHLDRSISIQSNATIAGQSAPGDGICIADKSVSLGGDNIIIRFMRFRLGDKWQRQAGKTDGSGGEDAFGGTRKKNIIIDHCSFSWSNDEAISVYAGDSTTLQWNIISEPLNYSYHFETGDADFENHGYGGIWGGRHLSAHHNLFAHCNNRNPRFDGIRNCPEELVDYRNNVIYNWGGNSIYAGEGGNYNLVDNYYKYGPNTNKDVRFRIVNPGKREAPFIPFGKFYVSGNYVDGAPDITRNNWGGIVMGNKGTEQDKRESIIDKPHWVVAIPSQSSVQAYEEVLKGSGASYKRDTLDARIINDVRTRGGRFIDVQGGFPHGTALEQTLKAWPFLESTKAPLDTDNDGMPDIWEKAKGLNPDNATDATAFTLDKSYTNLEVYLNELLKTN